MGPGRLTLHPGWIAFAALALAIPMGALVMRAPARAELPVQGGSIALLSISVDPERDTPEKLRTYADAFGARKSLWRYLTGPQKEVERTVVQGFHTAMAKLPVPGRDP